MMNNTNDINDPPMKFITHYGYHIRLDRMDDNLRKKTIKELTVCPIRMDMTPEDRVKETFLLYRYDRDRKHIIIPRYYGISQFGDPDQLVFNEQDIDIPFNAPLRPKQQDVVDMAINYMKKTGGGLLSVPCGFGKCLAPGTPVIRYDGLVVPVETIRPGDQLMGDDSTMRNVLSINNGSMQMYRVIDRINEHNYYDVNQQHILSLVYLGEKVFMYDKMEINKYTILDICLTDYLKLKSLIRNKLYGYRVAIEFPEKKTTENPFDYGLTVGDNPQKIISEESQQYMINSKKIRFEFLNGIVADQNRMINCVITSSKESADRIQFLARSLGMYSCIDQLYNDHKLQYVVEINEAPSITFMNGRQIHPYPIKIQVLTDNKYYGFALDGNHRFVLGCMTVTHNTVCALNIAHRIGLKTLVIVHKSFLLNQWIERIMEFCGLPRNKIGIIRQNKCDVEGKDIVVGMIQTISRHDYRDKLAGFGLTIYDEAHHVACRSFSRTMMKTGAMYTLALTATPYRSDGLIKIMYWFCGGTIYQEKMKVNTNVTVKTIHYKSTNRTLFASKKRWMLGQVRVDSGKMSTNLCIMKDRNQIIIDMIDHMRKNNPERKILILSGRINHLEYLKNSIDCLIEKDRKNRLIDDDEHLTYYYVGKCRQSQRAEAEEKGDIIFASYEMAQEGLDIKHLNTVILASPKKDIIQAIGRVMRTILKSGDARPLIIDMSDDLEVIRTWANIRQQVYNRSQYNIEHYYVENKQWIDEKDFGLMDTDTVDPDDTKNNPDDTKNNPDDTKNNPDDHMIDQLIDMNNMEQELFRRDIIEFRRYCCKMEGLCDNELEGVYRNQHFEQSLFRTKQIDDMRQIMYVPHLTEDDMIHEIVKDTRNDMTVDLDRDIELGKQNDSFCQDEDLITPVKSLFGTK